MPLRNVLILRAYAAGAILFSFLPTTGTAQSLEAVLVNVYNNNPVILAARAELEQTNEQVPTARSAYLPTVSLSRSYSRAKTHTVEEKNTTAADTSTDTLSVSQTVFNLANNARLEKADFEVQAQRRRLINSEQTVLLRATTSYLNVHRTENVVKLRSHNIEVLTAHLRSTEVQFDLRRRTNADLAQAKSRLAKGRADLATAQADLDKAISQFQQLTGFLPDNLEFPVFTHILPKTEKELEQLALSQHPTVQAAERAVDAARSEIDAQQGGRVPNLALSGSIADSSVNNRIGANSETITSTVAMTLTIPIFQAGTEFSSTRTARKAMRQRLLELDQARRVAIDNARQAWQDTISARSRVKAFESQIEAAKIALDGISAELEVGRRTVLDLLDAEQELLDAQVNLTTAKRDDMVAQFTLLERIGRYGAKDIGLDVIPYDPNADLNANGWNFYSTDVD